MKKTSSERINTEQRPNEKFPEENSIERDGLHVMYGAPGSPGGGQNGHYAVLENAAFLALWRRYAA